MSSARFFVDAPLSVGTDAQLPDDVTHHAVRVLRLRDGESVVLFNGQGGEYRATLRIDAATAAARIEAFWAIEGDGYLSWDRACRIEK